MQPVSIEQLYQSHYDCAYDGYKISGETLVSFGKQRVNEEKFYIKFVCKLVDFLVLCLSGFCFCFILNLQDTPGSIG